MPAWNIETIQLHYSFIRQLSTTNCPTVKIWGTWGHWGRRSSIRLLTTSAFVGRVSANMAACSTRYDVPEVPTSPVGSLSDGSVMTFTPYRPHNSSIFGRSLRGTT